MRCGTTLHAEDLPATAGEVAHDIAHELLGHEDVDPHDRFQQHRFRLADTVLEAHRPGDGERLLGRVHVVVRAVDKGDLDVHHRVAGEDAVGERVGDASPGRGDVLPRDGSAGDLADELESL